MAGVVGLVEGVEVDGEGVVTMTGKELSCYLDCYRLAYRKDVILPPVAKLGT